MGLDLITGLATGTMSGGLHLLIGTACYTGIGCLAGRVIASAVEGVVQGRDAVVIFDLGARLFFIPRMDLIEKLRVLERHV